MVLDLKKMKQKQVALSNKGGSGKQWFWKPQDGEQTIRIVPAADGDPFKEFWFHYNLGDNMAFLSPKKNFGEEDPLDKFVRKLFNEGSDESRELAKKLMAKQRFFSPVVVRGEEEKGVRLWGYSRTVYEKLLGLVLNPDYGDITDPDEGTDIVLRYGKKAGAMYPSTDVEPRRRSSPITESTDLSTELVNTEVDYDALFTRKTSEEVQVMLDQFLSEDDGSVGVSKYTATEKQDSVDKAFSELLG
jgi:hypothetical protein